MFTIVRNRAAATLALLAATVPAAVALTAAPASAARPTCTTGTDVGGAMLPSARNNNVDCRLRNGDRGDGVWTLQITLKDCYDENIATDGAFGARTEAALKRVQAKVRVEADGIWGPVTRDAVKHPYLGDSPCGYLG